MKLYQTNINRAKRAYAAALSPQKSAGEGINVPHGKGGARLSGAWRSVAGQERTTVRLSEPKENQVRFTAPGGKDSAFQEGWSARRLSAALERDARRYEKWL